MAKEKLVWHKIDTATFASKEAETAWTNLRKAMDTAKIARDAFEKIVAPKLLKATDKDGTKMIPEKHKPLFSYRFGGASFAVVLEGSDGKKASSGGIAL